jgi:hypothetical protein
VAGPLSSIRAGTLAGLAAATACAPSPARVAATSGERRQCFYPSQVSSFIGTARDRGIANVGRVRAYELVTSPGCPDLSFAEGVGLGARGGTRICRGEDAELIVPDASGTSARHCLVRSVRLLSSAEAAAALGDKHHP